MTVAEEEEIKVPNIPIVKRRSELKKLSRQLHAVLRDRKKELEKLERDIYDATKFDSAKSDTAGRKRELAKHLDAHKDYQELVIEVEKLESQVKEKDDIISDINFYQRERLVIAGNRYADSVDELNVTLKAFLAGNEGMAQTVGAFQKAVDKFVAARQK